MTMEPIIDAEIVDTADAHRLDKRIRLLVATIDNNLAKLHGLVEEAKHGEIHKALGFPSWTAYLADAFQVQIRIDRDKRRELVGYLSGEGMSQRAIASVVGVDQKTVSNDLRAGEEFSSPEPGPVFDDDQEAADCLAMAGLSDDEFDSVITQARAEGDLSRENVAQLSREKTPEYKLETPRSPIQAKQTAGLDGKTYSRQQETSKPRRKPITDEAMSIGLDLGRITRRLSKLLDDDRFAKNRAEIGCRIRPYPEHCLDVLERLNREIAAGVTDV